MNFVDAKNAVIIRDPLRQVSAGHEAQRRVVSLSAEVEYVRPGESRPSHDAVPRQPRPTAFNTQTSHTVTNIQSRTAHCRRPMCERMSIYEPNFEQGICRESDLDKSIDEPLHAGCPDSIVTSFETEVLSDIRTALECSPLARCCHHSHPRFIQLIDHEGSIGPEMGQRQSVLSFLKEARPEKVVL